MVETTDGGDSENFSNIWTRLREVYGDMVPKDIEAYVNVDADIETYIELSDEQIVDTIITQVTQQRTPLRVILKIRRKMMKQR